MEPDKQKILITAYDFYPNTGGVASYSLALAHNLAELGHDVLLVTKDRGKKLTQEINFKIKYIPLPKSGLTSTPLFAYHLHSVIKDFKPNKIINTLWMPGGTATAMALQFTERTIEFYVIVHAMEIIESRRTWKKKLRNRFKFLKKWTFKKATKIFCISQYTKALTLELTHCDPDKIEVIHNGVSLERFHSPDRKNAIHEKWEKHELRLLSLSRLLPHKGIDKVIQAFPKVLETYPKAHYLIGGTGPDLSRLKQLVENLELQNSVTFLGHVPDDYLCHYYDLSDLFILLSREEFPNVEGFGLVILEAAACGTPSLGGMSGGIPDAIIEGKTGWLVEPTDTDIIAEKLVSIFKNPEALKQMGESAYNYTKLNRTWSQVSQKILQQMDL